MSAFKFGLNTAKTSVVSTKLPQKRKALFNEENDDNDDQSDHQIRPPKVGPKSNLQSIRMKNGFENEDEEDVPKRSEEQKVAGLWPRKSPKLSHTKLSNNTENYTNLSALRSAKLHDAQASQIDSSVYDYDAAYETFHAPKREKDGSGSNGSAGTPKYMTSLLQSAEVRKRDQLRAKEKLLQKEREAEGDEFADKEKFVTGAYKKQQEEVKRLEEEEKRKEEEEEERRRKGGGMMAFHKQMLEKDGERMKAIEEANVTREQNGKESTPDTADVEVDESKVAKEMNEKGAKIVVNDDGEVVDKRQLLSAGLNVAPKKPGTASHQANKTQESGRGQDYARSSKAQDARMSQRERQTRMIERQIEELTEKQQQFELEEQKALGEKNKSKITESDKLSAKERYLQRKKEKEEEAKKSKAAG